MESHPKPTPIPPRLFKVVTLSIHRTNSMIEAQSESEAIDLAQEMSHTGVMVNQHSVATVAGSGWGGFCHG